MAILINNQGHGNDEWAQGFRQLLPQMPLRIYPDIPDKNEIRYAAVWEHPHGDLNTYPNLKAVMVLGAGMDHIDADPNPPAVPIVRLLDPVVGENMAQYAAYWLTHFQRDMECYRHQQAKQHWQRHDSPASREYRVGVLGQGLIGRCVAEKLHNLGFAVQAWNRSAKPHEQYPVFSGESGLRKVVSSSHSLVVCLPLKSQTRHLLDHGLLSAMPEGANLINISRGAIIDDEALLEVIKSQHLAGAALDAFAIEPLPDSHPFWQQKNIHITPHISGATYARFGVPVIVENILRMEKGQQPFPIYTPRGLKK